MAEQQGIQWTAFPKQAIFLELFKDVDEVLFGGAAGPGKSEALLIYSIQRRMQYPGSSGLYLRRNYTELTKEGGAIPRSHELLTGVARWNGELRKWIFPNGSVLEFGHCMDENDKYHYQSAAYLDIVFDELTQFTETMYKYIAFSRRRTVKAGAKIQIRAATNPGGIGHAWVMNRFIAPIGPYEVFKEVKEHPITKAPLVMTRAFVPADVKDNLLIMENNPEYILSLQELPENDRRALLEGRWDIFEGQVFTEWNDLHVCQPFEIPPDWPRWVSVDWGYESPWAVLWFTKDMKLWNTERIHRYYAYREVYERGVPTDQQAIKIRRLTGDERIRLHVADPSMWIKTKGPGSSNADDYIRLGIRPLQKAMNDRVIGKSHVHWMLGNAQDGLPRLRFFETCRNTIRTFPLLQHDKHKVEDVDSDGDDHCYDSTRYFSSSISQPQNMPRIDYRICA